MREKNHYHGKSPFGLFFGIILIFSGLMYLLYNIGIIEYPIVSILVSFPMLFFVISIYEICRRRFFWGTLIAISSLFCLVPRISKYYALPFQNQNIENIIFPILFILFGLAIISKFVYRKKKDYQYNEDEIIDNLNNSNFFKRLFSGKNVIFGSSKNIVISPLFKGTEINTIFGGTILDLRKTDIEEGETIVEANVIFGGIEIYVPSSWEIIINVTSILGATEDKRFYTDDKEFSNKKLIIKGSCIFGGIEIKN